MKRLRTAASEPGEADVGRLPVGESREGSGVALPVAVINGAHDEKTLYSQAASDGDELSGVGIKTSSY